MSEIIQFTTLARVKSLREQKALEALQKARRAVADAEARLAKLTDEIAESAATLPDRIHALYQDIVGETVDLPAIDMVAHRAAKLEAAHQRLEDRRARAEHKLVELREKADEAALAYRRAQTEREKYDGLLDDMKSEREGLVIAKEEAEIEDLFARPRARPGDAA